MYYLVPKESLYILLNQIKKHKITIYDLIVYDHDYYLLCTSFYDSIQIQKKIPNIIFYKSSGIIHYFISFYAKKFRMIGLLFSIFLFFILNQLNYGCILDKQYPYIDDLIMNKCNEYHISNITKQLDFQELENIQNAIFEDLNDVISYLEIYKEGKFYNIKYLKKVNEPKKNKSSAIYVSREDAIVDYIDIRSGNVLVEKGQYVNKNDIIVTNEIVSTDNQIHLVEVEGKIYGYVYHTFQSSVKGELDVDTFTYLYQEISKKIDKIIKDNGHIVSENVLQYTKKEGKIVLKVQFTLYQNIAQERFINE